MFGPIAATAYIAWWVIDTIDNWVRPWLPNILSADVYLSVTYSGLWRRHHNVGLTLLQFLTANFIGRSLVRFGEATLDQMPLIRGVHKGMKQVFETLFSQSGSQFRKVGLVRFSSPRELVACLHLLRPGRDHRRRLAGEKADDFGLHALHAEPDDRVLLLYSGRRGHRPRSPPTRRRNRHVGRSHPAARPGGARGNGGSGELAKPTMETHASAAP